MKLEKLRELHGVLDNIAVLQHFVDSPEGSLSIGMDGVENRIVISKELDLKVRILLGIQIEKMNEQLKGAGIDMTPEKPAEKTAEGKPDKSSGKSSEKAIDTTANESDDKEEAAVDDAEQDE